MNNDNNQTSEDKKEFNPFPHDLHGDYPMVEQKPLEKFSAKVEALESK